MSSKKAWADWQQEKTQYRTSQKPPTIVLSNVAKRFVKAMQNGRERVVVQKTDTQAAAALEIATYWMADLNIAFITEYKQEFDEGPFKSIPVINATIRWDDIVFTIG